jgi:hypothetical protein
MRGNESLNRIAGMRQSVAGFAFGTSPVDPIKVVGQQAIELFVVRSSRNYRHIEPSA